MIAPMLPYLRKHTKLIVWTVVIAFALWGAYAVGVQFQQSGRKAGEVFGKAVFYPEFNRFYRASQIFSFGGPPIEDPELLKHSAWQNIIYSREAKRQKIEVSDEEVRAELNRLLRAQGIENPTPQIYQRWLSQTVRESAKDFEAQIRELIRIQKLIVRVSNEVQESPAPEDARKIFFLESQSLTAEAVQFPTQAEAQNFYQKNRRVEKWGEAVKEQKLEVVPMENMSLRQLSSAAEISEEDVLALVKVPKGSIAQPVQAGSGFAIFQIKDKVQVSESDFTQEQQEKFMTKVQNEIKYRHFLKWNTELLQRANFKDYLPRSESPAGEAAPST
jgi:hypothetical protein